MTITSQALSYVFILLASLYGMITHSKDFQSVPFVFGTCVIAAVYAVFGVMKNGFEIQCDIIKPYRHFFRCLVPVTSMPYIEPDGWYEKRIVHLYSVWICVYLGLNLVTLKEGYVEEDADVKNSTDTSIMDTIFAFENQCDFVSLVLFMLANYNMERHVSSSFHLPFVEMYNYCITAYVLFVSRGGFNF